MQFAKRSAVMALALLLVACEKKKEEPKTPGDEQTAPAQPERKPIALPATLNTKDDTAAVLKAVKDAKLREDEFLAGSKGAYSPDIGDGIQGWIQPHIESHLGNGLVNGKVIGRIFVSSDVKAKGWKKGTWNYWIVAKFDGNPDWQSLLVNTSKGSVALGELTTNQEIHLEPHSRWVYNSAKIMALAAQPWVTCDGGECCCEGKSCDPPPIVLDSVPPNDTTKH